MAFIKAKSKRRSNWKAQERRRGAASVRQMIYDRLSNKEKLAQLDEGGFKASRQRKKLKIRLEDKISG